ncbi:hypothetical protein [Treponema sp.]|uniref:hypothetical protein n=1 Tax=Treponema sp. TaxID=166 RepID=UPI003F0D8C09
MKSSVTEIKGNSPQQENFSGRTLSPGDNVSVKVIKNLGNGNYTVLLRETRLNVKSEIPLSEGTFFKAVLELSADSKILLKTAPAQGTDFFSSGLRNFLDSAGISADSVSMGIVSQMIQCGVKIDKAAIKKARAVSSMFPGKEKEAAEIAAMLIEKGIEPEKEVIERFMLQLHPENWKDQSREKQTPDNGAENFLEKIYESPPEKKAGILTLANHIKTRNGNSRHWITLPYIWQPGKNEARGIIRILTDTDRKITEKILINCELKWKKYFFVLYFNNSKVCEVRFCTLPPLLTSRIHSEEERLGELLCSGMNGDSVTVTYSALTSSGDLYTEASFLFKDQNA